MYLIFHLYLCICGDCNFVDDYTPMHMQVMYNRANAYMCMGKASEAREELEKAKELSAITSESRHKIITDALDSVRVSHQLEFRF